MTSVAIDDPQTDQTLTVPVKSLRQRIVHGSFWALTGSVLGQGMTFLAILVCARFLGRDGFGQLGTIRNTVMLFGVFAGMGLGLTATKYVAEFLHSDLKKTSRVLRLCSVTAVVSGVVIAAVLALVAPYIARHILAAPDLTGPLRIGCVLLFLYALDGTQKGALAGFEAYKTIAQINGAMGVATLFLVVAGVRLGGLSGALVGLVISAALMLVANSLAVRRQCRIRKIPSGAVGFWAERGILARFSLPASLSNATVFTGVWVGNALLVNQPGGYAHMGIISATEQIRQMVVFVPLAALQCLLPILSSEMGREDSSGRSDKLYLVNSYTACYVTTSLVAIGLYFIDPLISIFGREFSVGRTAMMITLCSLPVATYRDGFNRLLEARALVWYSLLSRILWAGILVTAAVFLVRYGSAGLASANLIAYAFGTVVMVAVLYSRLDLRRSFRQDLILIGLLSAALAPGVVAYVLELSLPVKGICFILTITALFTATRVVLGWLNRPAQIAQRCNSNPGEQDV